MQLHYPWFLFGTQLLSLQKGITHDNEILSTNYGINFHLTSGPFILNYIRKRANEQICPASSFWYFGPVSVELCHNVYCVFFYISKHLHLRSKAYPFLKQYSCRYHPVIRFLTLSLIDDLLAV